MATKLKFLVAKEKMLVALVTVSVAISSPVITYCYVFGTVNKTMKIEGALHCIIEGDA